MSRWWKRTAMLVAGASLLVVLAVGSASARPFESTSVQKAQNHSLNIYGLGGRDDIAQGGGTDGSRMPDALKSVEDAISSTLQS